MSNLLSNKQFTINGNWYAPKNELYANFKSVSRVELMNTMSSAGNWDGLLVQTLTFKGKTYSYIIPFWQTNNWPSDGYTYGTGDVFARTENHVTDQLLYDVYQIFCEFNC